MKRKIHDLDWLIRLADKGGRTYITHLERDIEKRVVEREPIGGCYALSTLPRPFDCRPHERYGAATGIWMALPTLWCDD